MKEYFQMTGKKRMQYRLKKKNDKQIVTNYWPVSLLPVCYKIYERIIYNAMYNYISDNNIFSPNPSGLCTGDSCINQLLSITHHIYYSFNEGFETRAMFLDGIWTFPSWITAPRTIAPHEISPRIITPRLLPPGQLPLNNFPKTIAPYEIPPKTITPRTFAFRTINSQQFSEDNYPQTITPKYFPSGQ